MLADMTSDRILAVRVFKGELEKLSLKEHHSGIDIVIIDYLKMRIRDMERKGHTPS